MSEGGRRRIVSSAHLVSDKAAELSEVEYGLIVASNAFGLGRCAVRRRRSPNFLILPILA